MRDDRPSALLPFADGMVAAAALGELAAGASDVDPGSVAILAVFAGIAAAVFTRASYLSRVADVFYTGIGVLACVPVAAAFLRGTPCDSTPAALRYGVFLLLLVLAALGFFAGVTVLGFSPRFGLRWFGALELLTAATTFGTGELPRSPLPLIVLIALAMALGGAAAIRPGTVVDGGASLLAAGAILAAVLAPSCDSGPTANGLVLVLVFTATFFTVAAIARGVRTR